MFLFENSIARRGGIVKEKRAARSAPGNILALLGSEDNDVVYDKEKTKLLCALPLANSVLVAQKTLRLKTD